MKNEKNYPCDCSGICPFDADSSGMACRNNCGMGVDEDMPEDFEVEEEDFSDFDNEIDSLIEADRYELSDEEIESMNDLSDYYYDQNDEVVGY